MADIILGSNFKIYYNTDTGNSSLQGVNNVLIDNLAAFPTFTISSTANQFDTYDSDYLTTLLSEQTLEPLSISIYYVPDNSTAMFLDEMADSQQEFQIVMVYDYDEDNARISGAIVNGRISSFTTSGDKDEVLTRTYTFIHSDVVMRAMTVAASVPIYQGDYGVGSNTTDISQYQPDVPTGNSFIKVPAAQAGNPTATDLMGIGLVDADSVAELVMTKSGTLSLFAKNASTAWTRIYTVTQMDSTYVPLTRTVNGKALSSNIVLSASDLAGGTMTGALTVPALTVTGTTTAGTVNASDLTLVNALPASQGGTGNVNGTVGQLTTARTFITNLTSTTATGFDGTANNSHGVTGILPVANGGTGSSTAAGARTNLGLGTVATYNTGTSGATVPLLSTANTWTTTQNFENVNFGPSRTASTGLEIGSLTTAASSYIDFHTSGNNIDFDSRIIATGGSTTSGGGNINILANTITFQGTPNFTTAIPVTSGGTGATNAIDAGYNLAGMPRRGNMPDGADCNDYGPTSTAIGVWSVGTTAATANANLPEVNQGVFEVFQAGPYGCSQRFTTRYGNVYTRSLTANWTTTVHQWGTWGKVGLYGDSTSMNYVRNPSFLTGGSLPVIGNTATATLEFVQKSDSRVPAGCSGSTVAVITKSSTNVLHNLNFGSNNNESTLGFIPVAPGDVIDYSVLVAGTGMSTTSNLRVVVAQYTGSTFVSNVRINSYNPAGATVWQNLNGTYTIPANITNIVFGVWSETTAPAGSIAFVCEPSITKHQSLYAGSGANNDITSLTGLTTALSVAQGGTGSKTAIAAAYNIGALPLRGEIGTTANINTFGPTSAYIGVWGKLSSVGATIALGYPEDNAVGMLEVFPYNQYNGMQRFTIRGGKQYIRNLNLAWDGTSGPWGDWVRTGVDALNAIGYGLATTPLITDFDWQQADFVSGVMQAFVFGSSLNQPTGVNIATTTSVTIETLQARGNLWVVRMIPLTTSNDNRREYTITISGAKGSRVFYVTEIGRVGYLTDASPTSLGTTDLNTLGNLSAPTIYFQSQDANATLALNYPEANGAGTLFVTRGAWGGQQIFTNRKNSMYIRATSGTWNGTNGPWGVWQKIYTAANTTVDTSGFLKVASPIVQLFSDGSSVLNDEAYGATTTRISEGVYRIDGVLGTNSDAAWSGKDGGFEIPLDRNKQPKLWLDYEVESDGSILMKTYHRTHPNAPAFARNEIEGYNDGDPIDIPADTFISVRVEMPEDTREIDPQPEEIIPPVSVDDVINVAEESETGNHDSEILDQTLDNEEISLEYYGDKIQEGENK